MVLRYLKSLQETHSKIWNIVYSKLEMQPYLSSPLFSKENIGMLYNLRSRTIQSFRNNFCEQWKPNLSCPLCSRHVDSLPELLNTDTIQLSIKKKIWKHFLIVVRQKQATETYSVLSKLGEQLLNSLLDPIGSLDTRNIGIDSSPSSTQNWPSFSDSGKLR